MENYYVIHVYMDKNNEILIVPYARSDRNLRINVNFPQKMLWQGDAFAELGGKMLEAFQVSITHTGMKNDEIVNVCAEVTGIKRWGRFSKEYKSVTIRRDEDKQEYGFECRRWRLTYAEVGDESEGIVIKRKLPLAATAEEIGQETIEIFTEATRWCNDRTRSAPQGDCGVSKPVARRRRGFWFFQT